MKKGGGGRGERREGDEVGGELRGKKEMKMVNEKKRGRRDEGGGDESGGE